MIQSQQLLKELKGQVTALEDDLRTRCDTVPEVDAPLRAQYEAAKGRKRTALTYKAWREEELTQVAVAWVLGCVFVRFLEDNELVETPKLAGPGDRLRRARDEHELFFRKRPTETEREYLQEVFTEAGQLPGMKDFFARKHNPLWLAAPSGDACRELWQFWQKTDPETGALRHDFTDPEWNTRFLGDLYQDLSAAARKRYALLQTPEFVEEFILDRTLTPAIKTFGYQVARLIDPTCGSGHFLLGAFARLFRLWQEECPGENPRVLAQRALDGVYGVDLNPFAVAIARFRLLLVALAVSGVKRLKDAPDFQIHLAVGDSLLHGSEPGVHMDKAVLQLRIESSNGTYQAEDSAALAEILSRQYHAVVGNPPYITVKDPALNVAYRRIFTSCHRKYSLACPFMERFFDLGCISHEGQGASGFIGQITANSFMKAAFGKKLVEEVLPSWNVTHILDTEGVYLPGHGTATAIIFGRIEAPRSHLVRVAMGIQTEPEIPSEPSLGAVWLALTEQVDHCGTESRYFSVADIDREKLRIHPWNLGGGGASQLKEVLEGEATERLESRLTENGVFGITAADDAFAADYLDFRRKRVESGSIIRFVAGDEVRDWVLGGGDYAIFPYGEDGLRSIQDRPMWYSWLWPLRTELGNRATFEKNTYFQEGRPWWEWHQVALGRLEPPETIAYPFVSTHTHFIYERGRNAYNRPAPILKLKSGSPDTLYHSLVAALNSSSVCFWLKQVCQPKGGSGIGRGIQNESWEGRLSFNGSAVGKIPIPKVLPQALGARMDKTAKEWRAAASNSDGEDFSLCYEELISLQEELDWQCYRLYSLIEPDDNLEWPEDRLGDIPPLTLGERAFEIRMARQMEADELETTWFERHKHAGSRPITELPAHWPDDYRALVERRLAFIEANKNINLIERPEFKRRWNTEPWARRQQEALRKWLLARLEAYFFEGSRVCDLKGTFDPAAHGFTAATRPHLVSANQLADVVQSDPTFLAAAEVYTGASGFSVPKLVRELVEAEAVPFLPVHRYKASGLRKRQDWEETWALQRKEDAVEADVRRKNEGKTEAELKKLVREAQQEEVGDIPVPPKYGSGDFIKTSFWKLRGKLDVPKERWISYPGAERAGDDSSLIAWAGWNHLQQAQALAEFFIDAKEDQGWPSERLKPLLAGLADLIPWLQQWHNDHNPDYGMGLGDYFAGFLEEQCRALGFAVEEVETERFEI